MTRNRIPAILTMAVLLGAAAIAITFFMKGKSTKLDSEGYIGKSCIGIEDGRMTPEVLLVLGRLSDPQMSPDGQHILYGVSYTDVKGNRSVRNLFVCSPDGSGTVQLTESGKSISNARWCDGGKGIAFIMGGQIWTAKIKKDKDSWSLAGLHKVSDIPSGVAEFKLSPDQKKLMYMTYIKGPVKKPSDCYEDLDKADAYTTDDLMYRHWDHVVTEIPHTFISGFRFGKERSVLPENSADILSEDEKLFELPTEPFSGLEQLDWSPDGRYIAYSCRKLAGKRYAFSTDTEIYVYDTVNGTTAVLDMKGGYDTDPVWSPDGSMICWISMERDGYEADKQRLMAAKVNHSGEGLTFSDITDITASFKYNASAPVWSEDSGSIFFSALAEGLQGIFEAKSENGAWEISRITGEDAWYDFGSPFHVAYSGDGSRTLYTTWCSMDFPTEIAAVETGAEGVSYRQVTDENGHIISQLAEHRTEARMVKTIDGKDMLTWVLYPPHFDPSEVYPAILICLGGPQGTLSQGWSYRWNYRLMAAQGYVTILPNRRGTTAFGQEWTEQISGDYPGLNMQDYIYAAKDLQAEPYIGKMAACGASYGGYSVYNLCGVHGDVFDAFIAHAGIFNEEHMYMTTEEMWFPNFDNGGLHECTIDPEVGTEKAPCGPARDGLTFGGIMQGGSPWSTKPEAVRHYALSPHKAVTRWHTPLMVIHGGRDYRVPVDQGLAAYNAAQLMGVPSRLLVFPDENHWILKPQNALLWHREYFRWLDTWCKK